MSIATRLTSILRNLRFASGLAPRDVAESSAYLRWQVRRRLPNSALLKMPWGEFAFAHLGVARSQFEEIFVKRHYAFQATTTQPVIIDCGGNIGLSAIWFKQAYPACDLTVYEADAEISATLKANLTRAGCPEINVLNQAVWVENCELSFASTGLDTGNIDPRGRQTVRAIDLAEKLPARVDLLKMDIEGAEFDVLEHLLNRGVINKVHNLAVELHPSRETFPRMLALLKRMTEAGFHVSFESFVGPFRGLEADVSPFEVVGGNRMFVQAYFWRP